MNVRQSKTAPENDLTRSQKSMAYGTAHLANWHDKALWGSLTFKFNAGVIVHVEQNSDEKPPYDLLPRRAA